MISQRSWLQCKPSIMNELEDIVQAALSVPEIDALCHVGVINA